MQIGAYIAGADKQAQDTIYQFGIHIGLAFQIQDDILDVWGDPATFGKAVGGDISCNKKTFVYLEAIRQLGQKRETQGEALHNWYNQILEDNTEKIAAVKNIFEALDVRTACENVVKEYTQSALQLLDILPQNEATEQLRKLADKLNTRNS